MHNLSNKYPLTLERPGGSILGSSDLKFEAFKQSQWNIQYLKSDNERIFWRYLDDVITYNVCKLIM